MRLSIALFAALFAPVLSHADETQLLQAELALAKKNVVYSVIDLAQARIQIKAAGITLREFPIHAIDTWGPGFQAGAYVMTDRHAEEEPQRTLIDPKKAGSEASAELDALERADMPTNFVLNYEGNIAVHVIGKPAELGDRMREASREAWKYLSRPLVFLWKKFKQEEHTLIELELDPVDSQSIYWSLAEKSTSILVPPAD